MKGHLFSHEIGKTSSVFGRKHDINVVFQGDGAATDGSTIILPTLDHNADVSDQQQDIMRGYVDHEAGHVRHTDFRALKAFAEECGDNKLLRSVHNALEDVWLERRVIDEYPGAAENLKAVSTAVNKEFLDNITPDDPRLGDDKFITAVALTWEGRRDYGGLSQECIDMLPEDIQRQLPKWITSLDGCKDTADVITLAKLVEKEIRDGDYRDDREEETEGRGRKGNRGDGDDTGHGAGSGAGDDERGEEASAGDGDDRGDEGHGGQSGGDEGDDHGGGRVGSFDDGEGGRERGSRSAEGVGEFEDVYDNFDVATIVRKEIAEARESAVGGEVQYRPFTTANDQWHHRKAKTRFSRKLRTKTAKSYDNQLAAMTGEVNVMRRKLERALSAKMARDWDYGREDGRLDSRRLVGAFNGNPNVFKQRDDRAEMDTAFTMLIDLSGSMRHVKVRIAMQCAIAIAEAIDRTGITYEILGFSNARGHSYPHHTDPYADKYSRYEPLDMWMFKTFEERLFEAKGAIASIEDCATGNNSDAEAVQYAYERLRARPERRRVFMTLSDGSPACHVGGRADVGIQDKQLRKVVDRIEKDGTDVVGIGIADESVEQFYPRHVVVNSVNDLAGAAMDQLSRILLGERFQIDNSKLLAS
jgi:cobaltochelatase CobT